MVAVGLRFVLPQISARSNMVVLADEAHRSQYGFNAKQVTLKR